MSNTHFSAGGKEILFIEGGLLFRSPEKEITILWQDCKGLRKYPWSQTHWLKGSGKKIPLDFLSPAELSAFAQEFFSRWRSLYPEQAKKNAFDYIDGQKGFVTLMGAMSFFFALPLAYILFNDSAEQRACTKELSTDPVAAQMEVVKAKKKRKGHYILDLQFQTPEGALIVGRDQFITQDQTDPPKQMPLVYSKSNPKCWSLTPSIGSTEVNWAKRRFFAVFTFLFGSFFLVFGTLGLAWAFLRFQEKRPLADPLKQLFSLKTE